jgi:hypothetical protein
MPGLYFEEFAIGQTFQHPIRRTHVELLAVGMRDREGRVGFADQIRRQLAPGDRVSAGGTEYVVVAR